MRGKSHNCHILSNALKPGICVSGRVRPGPVGKTVGWPPVAGLLAPVAAAALLPPVAGLLPPVAGVARFIRTDALATARAVLVCVRCLMAAGIIWLRLRNIVSKGSWGILGLGVAARLDEETTTVFWVGRLY